jgi:adenosine deaminase
MACVDHTWLRNLPKVELHVHLDGSFDLAMLHDLTRDLAQDVPESFVCAVDGKERPLRAALEACNSPRDLANLVTCKGHRSFLPMLNCFWHILPLVKGRWDVLEELSRRFCKHQAEANIVYTEVRYSPQSFLLDPPPAVQGDPQPCVDAAVVVDAVTRGLRRGCAEYGVVVNQILCFIDFKPEWSSRCVELADERRTDFPCAVVGIDCAAGEMHLQENSSLHEPAFRRAQELGLNITVHAGELGGSKHIRYAMSNFGAKRIGHGYAIVGDAELFREAVEKCIHFEGCPTSSKETGAWTGPAADRLDWASHPIKAMLDGGMSVSFNSDDPSVFQSPLVGELAIGLEGMGLSKQQVVDCTRAAVEASFCGAEEKERLRGVLRAFD